ncbi:MAG: acyl-ACP--UDP-N-acetylglucosamine O-acyltransferase [Bryobacteraceae bacterium]
MAIDPSARIAPTAMVHPGAHIGPRSVIGEFCIVEDDVTIGANNILEPYVFLKRWTTLGDDNEISAQTVLGTDPLDRGFSGQRSFLKIGHRNKIREHYTISRGSKPETTTLIGDDNFIMTSGHIAHNAIIGNGTVIASCALVAGYAEVEDLAFLSGGALIHQFGKVGRLAIISGNTRVSLDAPPFFTYAGFKISPCGLNLIGLRRAGVSASEIQQLKKAYRLMYRNGLPLAVALDRIEKELPGPLTEHLVRFVRNSKRGICREPGKNQLE